MATWISGNRYLSQAESDNNAVCMYNFLNGTRHWTLNAIAAVAGNFYGESGLNPGIWQNLDEGNTSLGLGLGQWTPATKLLNWASDNGYPWDDGDSQCIFLDENAGQWHNSGRPGVPSTPPVDWDGFKTSTTSVETLCTWFYWYWEDPNYSDDTLPTRIAKANYYYELLSGRPPDPPDPPEPTPGKWGRKLKLTMMCPRRL